MSFNKQQWLKTVKHSIHSDGSISVQGDVDLREQNLTKIPFKFRKVTGDFDCSNNQLTSLNGCPASVSGDFYCYGNLKDFTKLDIENAMRASKIKSNLSSQTLDTFSDIIDEL
jgi:hypothetical protein